MWINDVAPWYCLISFLVLMVNLIGAPEFFPEGPSCRVFRQIMSRTVLWPVYAVCWLARGICADLGGV